MHGETTVPRRDLGTPIGRPFQHSPSWEKVKIVQNHMYEASYLSSALCAGMWYPYVCSECSLKLEPERGKDNYYVERRVQVHVQVRGRIPRKQNI